MGQQGVVQRDMGSPLQSRLAEADRSRHSRPSASGFATSSLGGIRPEVAPLLVGAITLLALALRLWHLTFQSLWWDEGVSIYLSGAGIRALTIGKDFAVDLHPPGYYLALAGWRVLLGPSVFADRLLSALAGAVTIPLVFDLSRRCQRPGASIVAPVLAALCAAVSPIDLYYSQETRMYALLPVLGLLSLIATARLVSSDGRGEGVVSSPGKQRQGDWALWVVASLAGLYTYYYLGLLTAAEALILLASALSRRQVRRWLLAQIATVILYLPWAAVMARRLSGASLALPPATAVHLTPFVYVTEIWQAFAVGFTEPPHASLLMVGIAFAVLSGAVTLLREERRLLGLLLLAVVVPAAGAGAVLLLRPFFYPRFIVFAIVPLWVLLGLGLARWRRAWPLSVVVVAMIVAGNGWTWYQERTTPRTGYAPDDYRIVFPSLAANAVPGDVVLCGYPWQAGYVQAYLWQSHLRTAYLPGRVEPRLVDQVIGPRGRAWVYEYSPDHRFEGNWLEQILGARDRTLFVDQYGDSRVRLFVSSQATSQASFRPRQTLGGEIALLAGQIQRTDSLGSGTEVRITLSWGDLVRPRGNYTVFVHLLGPDGKIVAQHDSPPVKGSFPTGGWTPGERLVDRYSLVLPAGAPAGRYRVEVGMYRPESGQRLSVGPVPAKDNRIIIGELSVAG